MKNIISIGVLGICGIYGISSAAPASAQFGKPAGGASSGPALQKEGSAVVPPVVAPPVSDPADDAERSLTVLPGRVETELAPGAAGVAKVARGLFDDGESTEIRGGRRPDSRPGLDRLSDLRPYRSEMSDTGSGYGKVARGDADGGASMAARAEQDGAGDGATPRARGEGRVPSLPGGDASYAPGPAAAQKPSPFDYGPFASEGFAPSGEPHAPDMMGRGDLDAQLAPDGKGFDLADVADAESNGIGWHGPLIQIDEPELNGALQYGKGHAGTLGTPVVSALGSARAGSTVRIFVESSAAGDTIGWLRVGSSALDMKLRSGANLLSEADVALMRLHVDAGTIEVELQVPADHEGDLFVQAILVDSGAQGGKSFSKGLQIFSVAE